MQQKHPQNGSSERAPDEASIESYLSSLHRHLVQVFQSQEARIRFHEDRWEKNGSGGGITSVIQGGDLFEKAGIAFSSVQGTHLPASATATRPALSGRPWAASGVSLVAHPRSPMIPTVHLNFRFFRTLETPGESNSPIWWFGGGFDLTPYIPFPEDCIRWHQQARDACLKHFDADFYEQIKRQCDTYFFLPHRQCTRGIGGIFFDDLNQPDADTCFGFIRSAAQAFESAYFEIVSRRSHQTYTEEQRHFQLKRRSRYVEFNLLYDRGTHFGLQSGGRTESILMSLPPLVRFDYPTESDPQEKTLENTYLQPKDWVNMGTTTEAF
jgi:coproporphyrinogen III oxidase